MMKRFLSLLIVLCTALSLSVPVMAEGLISPKPVVAVNAITVKVNGNVIDCAAYGQEPVILEGRTLVPLRAVFEALGATVDWNNETRTVVSQRDGVEISLTVDSDKLFVNGVEKTIDVPACIMNDRTMVPVRAVAEAFGCTVEWDNDTRTVIITDTAESVEEETETQEEVAEVEEAVTDDDKRDKAEQAVLNFWSAMNENDYAKASNYCNFDVQAYFDDMLNSAVESSEAEEIDPEIVAAIVNCYSKLFNAMFAKTEVEIESSEVIDENTVKVVCALSTPDFESVDSEKYLTEEKASEILIETMAKYGYDENSYIYSDEEDAQLIIADYLLQVIEFTVDAMIADIDNVPVVTSRNNEFLVEYIDGSWIVTEGLE